MEERHDRAPVRAHLGFFGGPLDSGNLGVSALGLSTLAAVARRIDAEVTIFDNGVGARSSRMTIAGHGLDVTQRGAWMSRRLHRPESLWQMLASSMVGGHGNANVQALGGTTQVWDISGGDSFSDIYGDKRFVQVALAKEISLRQSELVLLPQTYGPYRAARNRRWASSIVKRARESWARDEASHERLKELAGPDFDPSRHRQGVDVAFTLPRVRPDDASLGSVVASWLGDDVPVVGINVSGLLGDQSAADRFGLRIDHGAAMRMLVERFLAAEMRVLLIPHVQGVAAESDSRACARLAASFDGDDAVVVLPDGLDAMGMKWVISRMAWMSGARMHATIAALSSSTPVTGIAYSDKMQGVFASCGVGGQVADARRLDTRDFVDFLWEGHERRKATATSLRDHVPSTVATAESTFDHVVEGLRGDARG